MASSRKILVYDGDCRMCGQFSKLAERHWLCGEAERRPAAAFTGEEAERLQAAGVHNELAVIDPASGEIRSGYDGLIWLLGQGRLRPLAGVLGWGPVAFLLRHDYRLVAFNRRIFSPPDRSVACACDPDFHAGYRWAFIGVALLWSVLLGGVFAWLYADRRAWVGLAAPAGWVLAALPALRMERERALTWMGHLGWILAAAMLPFLAGLLVLAGQALCWRMGWVETPWAASRCVLQGFGLGASGLALVLVVVSCLRRLPRLGATKRSAVLAAVVLWSAPMLLLTLFPTAMP